MTLPAETDTHEHPDYVHVSAGTILEKMRMMVVARLRRQQDQADGCIVVVTQGEARRQQGGSRQVHPGQERLEPWVVADAVEDRHRRQMGGGGIAGVDRPVQPLENAVVAESRYA